MNIEDLKGKTRLLLHVQKYFAEKNALTDKQTEYLNTNLNTIVDKTIDKEEFK